MDIVSFKHNFDLLLARHLASKHTAYTNITSNPSVLSILSHIQKVSTGGKRLRPFIVWSLYAHQHKDASLEDIAPLLVAIELFHIFCLIHDDIMDEALVRHGIPTIHTHTKQSLEATNPDHNFSRASESQAILAGDILFNHVFELLNDPSWSTPSTRDAIRKVFTLLVDEVCIGQMLDINLTTQKVATTEAINEKNKLKTAYYSFARPLHIGALIAHRDDLVPFVLSFGEKIGIIFQIQDDILDVIGNPTETKKELFADLQENQHTLLSQYIRTHANPQFTETLSTFCNTPKNLLDPLAVRNLFIESGSISYAQKLIQEYTEESMLSITEAHLSPDDASLFTSILALLNHRTA